jgi:hypothetical protein
MNSSRDRLVEDFADRGPMTFLKIVHVALFTLAKVNSDLEGIIKKLTSILWFLKSIYN